MEKAEIIALLHKAIQSEHMAIVQYLLHAYRMGEGEMAAEIEAIAREEMRHFDWLSELAVELGGKPTIVRDELYGVVDDVVQNMRFDVQAEVDAIAMYRRYIELIDDPKIQLLLSRILSDEESHRGDFESFVAKAERGEVTGGGGEAGTEGAAMPKAPTPQPPARIAEILKMGMDHEYTVILQYLYHRYLMPDCEVGNEIEMQTINEMQHLGWLSEELVSVGGEAEMEHTSLALEGDAEDMLKADIAAEQAVTAAYSRQIPEIDDPDLKALVARIRDHEIYHAEVFRGLLDEIKAQEHKGEEPAPSPAPKTRPPSVGNLFGQKQD